MIGDLLIGCRVVFLQVIHDRGIHRIQHFLHHIRSYQNFMNWVFAFFPVNATFIGIAVNYYVYHAIHQGILICIKLVNGFFTNAQLRCNFVHANTADPVSQKQIVRLLRYPFLYLHNFKIRGKTIKTFIVTKVS